MVDLVIPGNDDAIRASQLVTFLIADAAREGRLLNEARRSDRAPQATQGGDDAAESQPDSDTAEEAS
jgi:small subunit ribosomal protein S2